MWSEVQSPGTDLLRMNGVTLNRLRTGLAVSTAASFAGKLGTQQPTYAAHSFKLHKMLSTAALFSNSETGTPTWQSWVKT